MTLDPLPRARSSNCMSMCLFKTFGKGSCAGSCYALSVPMPKPEPLAKLRALDRKLQEAKSGFGKQVKEQALHLHALLLIKIETYEKAHGVPPTQLLVTRVQRDLLVGLLGEPFPYILKKYAGVPMVCVEDTVALTGWIAI